MTQTYDIRVDVPVPTIRRGAPRTSYPFADINVGQAFFVPATDESEKVVERMKGACARWRKVNGMKGRKFTVAAVAHPDDPMGSTQVVGVWRTA